MKAIHKYQGVPDNRLDAVNNVMQRRQEYSFSSRAQLQRLISSMHNKQKEIPTCNHDSAGQQYSRHEQQKLKRKNPCKTKNDLVDYFIIEKKMETVAQQYMGNNAHSMEISK